MKPDNFMKKMYINKMRNSVAKTREKKEVITISSDELANILEKTFEFDKLEKMDTDVLNDYLITAFFVDVMIEKMFEKKDFAN